MKDIAAHLSQPVVSLWLMTEDGANAGYFELRGAKMFAGDRLLGLLPEFIGRGLGKHLLTCANRASLDGRREPCLAAHLHARRCGRDAEFT